MHWQIILTFTTSGKIDSRRHLSTLRTTLMSQASGWTIGTVGTLDIRSERNDDAVIGHQRHHIDTLGVETGFNGFGAPKVKLRVDANKYIRWNVRELFN